MEKNGCKQILEGFERDALRLLTLEVQNRLVDSFYGDDNSSQTSMYTPSHASVRALQQKIGLTDVKSASKEESKGFPFKEVCNRISIVLCSVHRSIHALIICHVLTLGAGISLWKN